MNLLVLGTSEMGAEIAQIACDRGHSVRVAGNRDKLQDGVHSGSTLLATDVVLDFTDPEALLPNIHACARAGKNMLVGTTGWHNLLPQVRDAVDRSGIGFLYGVDFSLTLKPVTFMTGTAASLRNRSCAGIGATRHVQRMLRPSATQQMVEKLLEDNRGLRMELGPGSGLADAQPFPFLAQMDARRAFAHGAVRAAEWLQGKRGFYHLKNVSREM